MLKLQWLAFLISIIGAYINIIKNKWGFIIWIVGNSIWIYLDLVNHLPAQALVFLIYSLLNVYGFYKWKKGERKI